MPFIVPNLVNKIARQLTKSIMTISAGESAIRCNRLVLMLKVGTEEKDMGGWGPEGLLGQIKRVLTEHLGTYAWKKQLQVVGTIGQRAECFRRDLAELEKAYGLRVVQGPSDPGAGLWVLDSETKGTNFIGSFTEREKFAV